MLFQTNTFFDTFSETFVFWKSSDILCTLSIVCLFGRLGRHEAREQIRLGEKESFAPEFSQVSLLHDTSHHKISYWGIVACTHLELIGWLKALSNLWHGFAALFMRELGH